MSGSLAKMTKAGLSSYSPYAQDTLEWTTTLLMPNQRPDSFSGIYFGHKSPKTHTLMNQDGVGLTQKTVSKFCSTQFRFHQH